MGKLNFCFIRKNTPEIQERLKQLGIPHNDFDEGNRPWIAYNHGLWISVDEGHDRLFKGDIDCGDSEDLFFALITYNKDKDKNQWFVCVQEYISNHTMDIIKIGTWQLNTQFDKLPYSMSGLWKKATVEELIQHFKSE